MDLFEPARWSTPLRGAWLQNEPMARHVSWRTGGAAERMYVPTDIDDLSAMLRQLPVSTPVTFIGLGSNTLVRDGGIAGVVVLMHAAGLHPVIRHERVWVPAGAASPKVARFAALHDRVGAEFLAGIPGTFGGALAMNAGCYGADTWSIVEQVQTIDRLGVLRWHTPQAFDICYRHCQLRDTQPDTAVWFTAAVLNLAHGDGLASRAKIKALLQQRIATQPLQLPNAGSVFRNPPGDHAARLIEQCGLKGLVRGGARISEKHANFIVNPKGLGSAADIEWLIHSARNTVHEKTGVALQPEVRLLGEVRTCVL